MATSYDIIIVGGGLAGVSLAACLQNTTLRIAIVETTPWSADASSSPSYDDKVLALSHSTYRIFASMGLWQQIAPYVIPIKNIHVSEQQQFGITRLNNQVFGVPALGYVIRARHLGQVLQHALQSSSLTIFSPASPTQLKVHPTFAEIVVDTGHQIHTLQTRLVVAADGAQSKLRQLAGLVVKNHDYLQDALIANVTLQYPHRYTAYERFTTNGPIALLPLTDNDCALIWTMGRANVIQTLADQPFLATLQQQFGWRLGRFTRIGKRQVYPLHLRYTPQPVCPRVVVVGNAAHTLHPIAGQGFNLGLRDVAHLAEVLQEAQQLRQDIGTLAVLQQYVMRQQPDQKRVAYLTDSLVNLFSNAFPPLTIARNVGLILTDIFPPIKKLLISQMSGLNNYPSRLVRGLPLP